ncbi:hypothetical protein NJC40_03765 [Pseudomonas sp. 21LCFQ02]|uniref:hypothetical protein n=1 Tax=Pseudomonas sp. 21LCFQ02 TaxID=2957505 RepID=UPI00209B56C4|nr:hypothetical protein [Pseudomonas sp. 21LCFQ02]MCO8166896.1 hypothetical protein [Pseudomonas sp. 21LCFQ02]
MSDLVKKVELPISCQVGSSTWRLFTFDYQTPDGVFCGYLYAISTEHAAAMLMDMKETATLQGEMKGVSL